MNNFSLYQENLPINVINGKINNLSDENRLKYLDEQSTLSCSFQSEGVGPTIQRNPISDIYFSIENINALQQGLRNMVLNQTNGKYNIPRQNDTELKIVMRSIYLQYARHYKNIPVLEQVKSLNFRVLEWCVKDIISSIKQKERYLQDIERFPDPLEHPSMVSNKGSKQLEFHGWM